MKPRHRSNNKQTTNSNKGLHPRNIHQSYDFPALVNSHPALGTFVSENKYGKLSIDFADSKAVTTLNAALLKHYYQIDWHLPDGALCPPIPGRVDYIHYIADLLGSDTSVTNPNKIKMLDIGTGANGIYSILASQVYGWKCIGSDINQQSLDNVAAIIADNKSLQNAITLRLQSNKNQIFRGIIESEDYFDVTVCNPPFHASLEEALRANQRKVDNLARNRGDQPNKTQNTKSSGANTFNFGGSEAELWCNGGERLFLKKMIKESQDFSNQCRWFTSLVSKSDNIKPSVKLLRKQGVTDVREIEMPQGNKITRILAWTYH